MRKPYKETKIHKDSGVIEVWGKNKNSNQSVVHFEEPKLQESYEKYVESAKKLSQEDKKILVKEIED